MGDLNFRFVSVKSIFVLTLIVYKLMIGSSKNNRENYPRKCFWLLTIEPRNFICPCWLPEYTVQCNGCEKDILPVDLPQSVSISAAEINPAV